MFYICVNIIVIFQYCDEELNSIFCDIPCVVLIISFFFIVCVLNILKKGRNFKTLKKGNFVKV